MSNGDQLIACFDQSFSSTLHVINASRSTQQLNPKLPSTLPKEKDLWDTLAKRFRPQSKKKFSKTKLSVEK